MSTERVLKKRLQNVRAREILTSHQGRTGDSQSTGEGNGTLSIFIWASITSLCGCISECRRWHLLNADAVLKASC
jgi:hypothetical protein